MTPHKLQKLTAAELQEQLNAAAHEAREAESNLSMIYREYDRRRGRLAVIEGNALTNPFNFDLIKRRAHRAIERIVEEGLAGELTMGEGRAVYSMLKDYRCDIGVAAHALIVAVISHIATFGGGYGNALPFPYLLDEKEPRQCH